MSFHLEFTASNVADAKALIAEAQVPDAVKSFLTTAVEAAGEKPVSVKASGHLYGADYGVSTATIEVKPLTFTQPKTPPVLAPTPSAA